MYTFVNSLRKKPKTRVNFQETKAFNTQFMIDTLKGDKGTVFYSYRFKRNCDNSGLTRSFLLPGTDISIQKTKKLLKSQHLLPVCGHTGL